MVDRNKLPFEWWVSWMAMNTNCLPDWLWDWIIDWLTERPNNRLDVLLTDWLTVENDWLTEANFLAELLTGWPVGWQTIFSMFCLHAFLMFLPDHTAWCDLHVRSVFLPIMNTGCSRSNALVDLPSDREPTPWELSNDLKRAIFTTAETCDALRIVL